MSAGNALLEVSRVVSMLGAVARAFGLDEEHVIRVAARELPDLRPTPPDEARDYNEALERALDGDG